MKKISEITICLGSSCFSRGNKDIMPLVKSFLMENNLDAKIFFKGELCSSLCDKGPVLKLGEVVHENVQVEKVQALLTAFFNLKK